MCIFSLPQAPSYRVHDRAYCIHASGRRKGTIICVCTVIKAHMHPIDIGRENTSCLSLSSEPTKGGVVAQKCVFVYVSYCLLMDIGGAFAPANGSNTRMCVTNLMRSISNMERQFHSRIKKKKQQHAICFNGTSFDNRIRLVLDVQQISSHSYV